MTDRCIIKGGGQTIKKRMIAALLLVLLLALTACGRKDELPEEVILGGRLYFVFEGMNLDPPVTPTEADYAGTIKSCRQPAPAENEETNVSSLVGQPYALVEGNYFVLYGDKWTVCTVPGEVE